MTIVRAGEKDLILPGDGFDAFVDFVFNTPSQPELCEMKKENIILAAKLTEPTVAAAADGASTQNEGKAAPPFAALSAKTQEKKNNPISNPPGNATNCANKEEIVEDVQKAKLDRSYVREEKGDNEAYHRPYVFKLSLSYLDSIKKQSLGVDYSDSHSVTSGVSGDSSAWSFSAVGKDDDTYASIDDKPFGAFFRNAINYEEKVDDDSDEPVINKPYFCNDSSAWSFSAVGKDDDTYASIDDKPFGAFFRNAINYEEKVDDDSDEPVVNKPYFCKSSSSYLSEKSGHEDGNSSIRSFSAAGAGNETYVSGVKGYSQWFTGRRNNVADAVMRASLVAEKSIMNLNKRWVQGHRGFP
jgi:hypothetical protein